MAVAGAALAQPYPPPRIKLIVPWPPGGGVDTSARIIAQPLPDRPGQSLVIDNCGCYMPFNSATRACSLASAARLRLRSPRISVHAASVLSYSAVARLHKASASSAATSIAWQSASMRASAASASSSVSMASRRSGTSVRRSGPRYVPERSSKRRSAWRARRSAEGSSAMCRNDGIGRPDCKQYRKQCCKPTLYRIPLLASLAARRSVLVTGVSKVV